MFAEKLSPLIDNFPQHAEALRRMEAYLGDFESRRGNAVRNMRLDPSRMFEILQAGSTSRLAGLVAILIEGRVFRRQVLVRFPSGSGITFPSYAELPNVIRDPDRDIDVEVTQDNIEASYVLVTNEIG
ncbi:hypothetical protein SAMN05216496_5602 [Pseudomonas sp. Z003-0.4C(8344-21)]|uniref:hypothetical protein n=1 Tax=Pseudomonas sp. Z003-0.4C(8344-21) TaxID=1855380 RepID=UPI000879BE0A|nr:hypothetical protein [Pseudomonas sp. Z003-0.4C(8344-21)]SDT59911.1 hypothetical protein SAMN05216496_5602 [Pseudomonas sp. Z003-0.4C(8344-21)]